MIDGGLLGHIWYWIEVHTGTVNESGPYYGFFSGFGSDIGEVTVITGVALLIWHMNCHTPGCKRLTRQTTPDGYKLCRKCLPKSKKELGLHEVHDDHQRKVK